jgi:hypothetical protein
MAPRSAARAALGLLAGAALLAPAAAQFNYTFCGLPGASPQTTVQIGDSASLCVNLNGQVRSVFTPRVDTYSAFQLIGSACLETDCRLRRGPPE